jgi:hypothetical protein
MTGENDRFPWTLRAWQRGHGAATLSTAPNPLQEADHCRLAAMPLAVGHPELAQPLALALPLPLLDHPQGILPDDAFGAQSMEVGDLI